MNRGRLVRIFVCLLITIVSVSAALFLHPNKVDAGIYDRETADTTYAEYWIGHSGNYSGLCDNTGLNNTFVQTFIEPKKGSGGCVKTLDFNMPSLTAQNEVEIYVDLWRNRDTPSAAFQINDSSVYQTDVGSDWSRTPYFRTIPNDVFKVGSTNQITFTDTAGQYHVKDVAFRVYGPAVGNTPDGGLVGIHADNGWFDPMGTITDALQIDSDQLVLSATASANTDYIEFHAYYDGYDEDNDGVFQDWHNKGENNLHPGGIYESLTGGTIDHIGTVQVTGAGTYSITWNLPHIISQSGVRFKVRLVNKEGNVNYVRDAAGGVSTGVTLSRSTPTVYFIDPTFEDSPLYPQDPNDEYPDIPTYEVNIDLPPDISDFDTAYLIGAYWNNPRISINNGPVHNAFPNASPLNAGEWFLSVLEINVNEFHGGTNTVKFINRNAWGEFIEKPGPMIVLKRLAPIGNDTTAPYVYNQTPVDNASLVEPNANISMDVFDAGGMDIHNTLTMSVKIGNGSFSQVAPTITGSEFNAHLLYNPPSDLPFGTVITVQLEACDLANNCAVSTWSFTTRQEIVPSSIASDDFNACSLDTGIWTTAGDGTIVLDGERVSITAPSGVVHDLYNTTNNAPRIMQAANNQDFDIQVKFDSTVNQMIQAQGIVIEQDADDYLRVNFQYDAFSTSGRVYVRTYKTVGGSTSEIGSKQWVPGAENGGPLYLRIIRSGLLDWSIYYSQDGVNWKPAQSAQNYSLTVSQVGAYAINYPADVTHTAVIDYFFNTASPIDPEDNSPLLLETSVIGSGEIVKSSQCGNPVTVSANADPGWTFDHWSGVTAVEGSDNPSPGEISFDVGDTLVAHFTRDEYTLNIDVISVDHEGTSTSSTAGGIVTTDQDFPYYYDDVVTLTANPKPGWTFTGWQGAGLSGSHLSKTLTMQQTESVTATFTQDKYGITVIQPAHGEIIVSMPTASRDYLIYGEEVTLEAKQTESEWKFMGWGGDLAGSNQNPIIVVVTDNLNVTATFSDKYYIFLPMVIRP